PISKLTPLFKSLVNKSRPWLQRKKRIVDLGREIRWTDVVSCGRDCQTRCKQCKRSGQSGYSVLSFHDLILFSLFLRDVVGAWPLMLTHRSGGCKLQLVTASAKARSTR